MVLVVDDVHENKMEHEETKIDVRVDLDTKEIDSEVINEQSTITGVENNIAMISNSGVNENDMGKYFKYNVNFIQTFN